MSVQSGLLCLKEPCIHDSHSSFWPGLSFRSSSSLLLLPLGDVFILPACLASLGSRCTWFCERVHPALVAAEWRPSLAPPLLFDREHCDLSVVHFLLSVLFLCFQCLFNFCSFCVLWSSASNVSSTCCYPKFFYLFIHISSLAPR